LIDDVFKASHFAPQRTKYVRRCGIRVLKLVNVQFG
jgi:hypothetical protein